MSVRFGARRMEAAHTRLKGVVGLDYWPFAGRFALNGPYVSSPEALPGSTYSQTGAGTLIHPTTGQVIPFASGQRRWAVGAGELVEGARTNSLLHSNTFSNAVWLASGAKNLVANNAIGPDGTLSASTLTDNSAAAFQGMSQAVTVPNDTASRVVSIFVAKTTGGTSPTFGINSQYTGGTTSAASVRLNTDTGAVVGSGASSQGADNLGAFWRLWFVHANNGTGNTTHNVLIFPATSAHGGGSSDSASATGSAVIWQADNQASSFPTSPIITTGAAGTRGADDARINGLAFGPRGTAVVRFVVPQLISSTRALLATTNGDVQLYNFGSSVLFFHSSGTLSRSGVVAGAVATAAVTWEPGRRALALNGGAVVSDTNNVSSTVNLSVGSIAGASALNGDIQRLRLFPNPVSDAELQALAA